MKITETIERECCEPRDMRKMGDSSGFSFCCYCGRQKFKGSFLPWPWQKVKDKRARVPKRDEILKTISDISLFHKVVQWPIAEKAWKNFVYDVANHFWHLGMKGKTK